jgi:hypothetical protein
VREVLGSAYDRRDGRLLVFMSDDIMRRVRNYPSDWHMWADEDLYRLSLAIDRDLLYAWRRAPSCIRKR